MRRDMVSSDETVAMEADAPETVSSAGVVKWERFLPTMALRVLLVESDDSTRQIIAALLRKCSYRVAAVTDGLKAWEILKGRPHNIDLILTEVDLPSISGFALLTLIQEHDVCKKIPVIMMSSKDSISTVYKCMTRGAADYLVKPVRINELKNLWQHVWRRQLSSKNTNGQQDESEAPQKVEATAENDAASNRSSGKGDNESLGKGSDAQSSCTKPDVDADMAEIEQKQDYNANEFLKKDEKVSTVDSAINLIGAFDNSPRRIYIDSSLKSDLQPDLGLSLRQSDPSCITNQKHQEKHSLKHSDASAFSRYMNKPLISPHSGSVNLQNQEFPRITENQNTVQSTQAGNSEYYVKPHHQQRVFPAPILVKGIRFGDYRSQSGSSPAPLIRADSFQQSSCENNNFDCIMRDPHDQNPCNSPSNQSRQNHELRKLEERAAHISPPATDGSGSSSFCNGTTLTTTGFNNIMDCGSGTGEDSSQRSIQREAALAKFRLKRKERCFEKKVRYESRKKLAEQRPRVKGQFVRQVQTDGETNL